MHVNVINMTQELPQFPEEHLDFWNIWCNVIKTNCPDIDVIYSSEDYGFELAKRLGISHELVDKERIKHPISGTKIRNNPYDNWQKMYIGAMSYFLNRMYFLGPESTGKTTISKLLSEKYYSNWVPEYGRVLCEKNDGNIELMDFYEIVIKQREIEDNLAQRTQRKTLFCDTETITTKVFCELYYPDKHKQLTDFFNYHIEKQIKNNKCHFFVMNPAGTEAVQDGTRLNISEDKRQTHFNKLVEELTFWKVPFTILYGNYEHRIYMVEQYIENILPNIQQEMNEVISLDIER